MRITILSRIILLIKTVIFWEMSESVAAFVIAEWEKIEVRIEWNGCLCALIFDRIGFKVETGFLSCKKAILTVLQSEHIVNAIKGLFKVLYHKSRFKQSNSKNSHPNSYRKVLSFSSFYTSSTIRNTNKSIVILISSIYASLCLC